MRLRLYFVVPFLLMAFSFYAQVQKKPSVSWRGKPYCGSVVIQMKNGQECKGIVKGGVNEEKIIVLIPAKGVTVPILFSQISSIQTGVYDNTLEKQGDGFRDQALAILNGPSPSHGDLNKAKNLFLEAEKTYRRALECAVKPEDKNRIQREINRIQEGFRLLRERSTDRNTRKKADEHWRGIEKAFDSLDHVRAHDMLIEHAEKFPDDQRTWSYAKQWLVIYENLQGEKKKDAAIIAGRLLHACNQAGRLPPEETWPVLDELLTDYLVCLGEPGDKASLTNYYQGATAIINLLKKNQKLYASKGEWSSDAVKKDPLRFLSISAGNELLGKHPMAGDKIRLLLEIDRNEENLELLANWHLSQRRLDQAFQTFQEIIQMKGEAGDPKLEKIVREIETIQKDIAQDISQDRLSKAKDTLIRLYEINTSPFLHELIGEYAAKCDLLIIRKQLQNPGRDSAQLYEHIVKRLDGYRNLSASEDFFELFRQILTDFPLKYEYAMISQGSVVNVPSSLVEFVGEKILKHPDAGTEDTPISLKITLNIQVSKEGSTNYRQVRNPVYEEEEEEEYDRNRKKMVKKTKKRVRWQTNTVSDHYCITNKAVRGNFELRDKSYGILINGPIYETDSIKKVVVSGSSLKTSNKGLVNNPQYSHYFRTPGSGEARDLCLGLMDTALKNSKLGSLEYLLRSAFFDQKRKFNFREIK